jgi:hypothetical protein
MRTLLFVVIALIVLSPAVLFAADVKDIPTLPLMQVIDPYNAVAGQTVTITGERLGKAFVNEVFLTKGNTDLKLELVVQTDTRLTLRIPKDTPTGRFRLMVLTAGAEPRFIEQPLSVNVQGE